jgi:hypothetical protein
MMNVLDALRMKLARPGGEDMGEPSLDPALMALINRQRLPPGLPLGVQDSILNQPSYSEGGVMPGPRNPLMEQEHALGVFNAPQREQPLSDAVGIADFLKYQDIWPMPEGAYPPAVGRQNSPYATRLPSALNQLMRRGPFGQY